MYRYEFVSISQLNEGNTSDIAYRAKIENFQIFIYDSKNRKYIQANYPQRNHIIECSEFLNEQEFFSYFSQGNKNEFYIIDKEFPEWVESEWLGNETSNAPRLDDQVSNWEDMSLK